MRALNESRLQQTRKLLHIVEQASQNDILIVMATCDDTQARREELIRIFGQSESDITDKVKKCLGDLNAKATYRVIFPEIQLLLSTSDAAIDLSTLASTITDSIGKDYIFSNKSDINFEQALYNIIDKLGISISLAESCTGGLVSTLLTNIPGSSGNFLGSVVTYSNASKQKLLDVDSSILESEGAVSNSVAQMMASGVRKLFNSDYAISVTGIAGPTGGSPTKPVGTFFIGIASSEYVKAYHFFYPSSRHRIRSFAAYTALDVLRRTLLRYTVRTSIPPLISQESAS